MGLCCPLWPAFLVIHSNVAVCVLGFCWNPILRRNWIVWDSYFHWLDVVLKGLFVLCHLICRFSVTCLTENNWVMYVGSCCLHGPTFPSDGFHDILLIFQYHWSFGWKVSWWERWYSWEIHLRNKRYFNQSWLDVDGGFTKSTDYQFATESQCMEICIKVSVIMYSEGQRRVEVMERYSQPNILRICNHCQPCQKELQKNVLNYVGLPIKVFVPFIWSRLDQQHYVLCTWRKTKPIPLLCDAHFEELSNLGKCPGGKIVFCQRVKYISTIGDILIQGYLMLMDALQNLLFTQRKICNGNQEIYCNINHHVFRRSKAHGCDGRKLTSKDNKNLQSLHNLVRTDQP